VIPDYGANRRRSTQEGTYRLLDEAVDIEEATPDGDPAAADATPAPPAAVPDSVGSDPPPPTPPAPLDLAALDAAAAVSPADDAGPPPPPPPPAAPEARRDRSDGGRFGFVIPLLLAALGLTAAVIAWRAGVSASAADDANRAGLDAARQRAAAVVIDEGLVARNEAAYLDYERATQRADALAKAGVNDQALLNRMQAAGDWFLVPSQYLDRAGQFQPAQERSALLADDEQQSDLQALPHFSEADAEYDRLRGLIGAGIVVAIALPLLTLAEIGRGRLRIVTALAGVGVFGVGLVLAVIAWL
jgi:hypothetical protein